MKRIVVGIDGSEVAHQALRWAVDEARVHGAALEVLHAWHMPYPIGQLWPMPMFDPELFEDSARASLDAAVDSVDTAGLAYPVERKVVSGAAVFVILEAAKGADLVVLGSRGVGGFSGLLLGSVSQQVVHHATCPVVVVPYAEAQDDF